MTHSQQPSHQTVEQLRRQIRQVETGRALEESELVMSGAISSGLVAMDQLLPDGGYLRGTIVEWLVPDEQTMGFGAEILSLQIAQRAAESGGVIVVVDPGQEFYPLAARSLGVSLERLVILRGGRLKDLYWSIDQALRCEAVAAVWAAATIRRPEFLVDLDDRWQRRFQLSAEVGGTLGLWVRSDRVARQPTWSDVQWLVKRTGRSQQDAQRWSRDSVDLWSLPEEHWQRPVSVQLLKCRGGRAGQTLHLNLDSRTGVWSIDSGRRWERAVVPSLPSAGERTLPVVSAPGRVG